LKKIIAILLLIIHVFNLAGYRALFTYLQQKASTQIVDKLDQGSYQDADLVEVKIPYPLPYAANWPQYERFDGEAEMNGIHYNYVKRKMVNDTLYILCIPNNERNKIATAKNDYFNSTNDVNNPSSNKKSPAQSIQKSFGNEYNDAVSSYNICPPVQLYFQSYSFTKYELPDSYIYTPFQPPKA
jgi:hypothetical protein